MQPAQFCQLRHLGYPQPSEHIAACSGVSVTEHIGGCVEVDSGHLFGGIAVEHVGSDRCVQGYLHGCEDGFIPCLNADRCCIQDAGVWWGRILKAKVLGKVVSTPTPCSCWMCGNPHRCLRDEHVSKLQADARDRVDLDLLPN